ncbi:3-deoxy-manno-octulosonate cytidylyltransferase (CMP-KDO synthetase) [Novosphingobium sp. PhB165]|uniref:3-deoxy-manno-octulosonate cytidylyltransferase n=1 Tax=Novosphingobium sp. PhB165 TaxID=2485105 RepID=UPI0010483EEF|nr:manno-octulosonate cytidylyltransferase [Novosphingobium sp. PhB165]TCM20753.1 3-deoxy-manno-octulosonate cytidylyltransferase (CMP-KDO synthetase) [Novosphingobium sp. PhB165]
MLEDNCTDTNSVGTSPVDVSFAILIPARYASTRYPGKPLVRLTGATGEERSLIRRSWDCAMAVGGAAKGLVGVWVATDDDRIAEEVESFGGQVVMTSPDCANGTERCAQAITRLGPVADVIVNLQGDAPLSPASVIPRLVERLSHDPEAVMATPAVRASRSVYAHLTQDQAEGRVGGTTAVIDGRGRALYFSKRVLPYLPPEAAAMEFPPVHLHLGLYAYRPAALELYAAAAACELEKLEGLEQLRFLDLGLPVSVVTLDPLEWDAIELNNPGDKPVIERILKARGIV